jgi:hypothetical protein
MVKLPDGHAGFHRELLLVKVLLITGQTVITVTFLPASEQQGGSADSSLPASRSNHS